MLSVKKALCSPLYLSDDVHVVLNEIVEEEFKGEHGEINVDFVLEDEDLSKEYPDNKVKEILLTHPFETNIKDKDGNLVSQKTYVRESIKLFSMRLFINAVKSLMDKKRLINNCEHSVVRPTDKFGSQLNDGTGVCSVCDLRMKDALEPLLTGYPPLKDGTYVSQNPWGDDVFVQGDDSGLVISDKAGDNGYFTAFFEAFPKVLGVGVFIRGEGKDLSLAEKDAWEKYQKALECKEHDFSRTVNGTRRTDGYAICTKCKVFGMFLVPETKCIICEKPTSNTFAEKVLCYKHQYELSDKNVVEMVLTQASREMVSRDAEFRKNNEFTRVFKEIFVTRLMRASAALIGDDELEKNHKYISVLVRQTYNAMISNLFGLRTGQNIKSTVSLAEETVKQIENVYIRNLKNMFSEEPKKNCWLLPEHLIKKKSA